MKAVSIFRSFARWGALLLAVLAIGLAIAGGYRLGRANDSQSKGYDIQATGLKPKYPSRFQCSELTSLYASWDDVDGSRRDEPHSGVDGGRFGEWIIAPGTGTIVAAWETNTGWGPEAAVLMRHSREDIGLVADPPYYYSVFDHLNYNEVQKLQEGRVIQRGERFARVWRPGGNKKHLPEVHWEIWEVKSDDALRWYTDVYNLKGWTNSTARLVDPLYMLSLNNPPNEDGDVAIEPFVKGKSYKNFRGFTYIFECRRSRR